MLQPDAKSLEASARAQKREALLDAAAEEFNARGISGASIARIARSIGLTRAALYYYVKDRNELVAQCYRRTCEVIEADLGEAEKASNGLSRVIAFVRLSLDPERRETAVLSELDYLDGKIRAAIGAAHMRNVGHLRALIRHGIEDGSIRACDDEIAAQMLIGTIFWIPLSVDWVEGTEDAYRAKTVGALIDLIENGQAKDPAFEFVPPVAIESFFLAPASAFDRDANAAAKIEQLLATASQLFNRRGIDGASLDDITHALGATKGAFYHYLDNKTELVIRCYRRAFSLYERFADAAEAAGRTGLERGLTGVYLNTQAHVAGLSPLVQMVGVSALPPQAKREITRRARALQRRFEGFGAEGRDDGSYRADVDFATVSQLGAGPFQWLPKWYEPKDTRGREMLAKEMTDFFIRGLRQRQDRLRR